MATDYISREAAIKEARNLYPSIDHYCTSVKAVPLGDLNAIPAADVSPVVHAHWVYLGLGVYKCSDCLGDYNDNTAFCPNCGAKMDEEAPER